MIVYAFDCDETLEISSGPVKIADLVELRNQGHILGICGNWGHVVRSINGWHHVFSFLGQMALQKHEFLHQIKTYVPADDYVMVGNDHSKPRPGGYQSPNDAMFAAAAGWRFISETDFANGSR